MAERKDAADNRAEFQWDDDNTPKNWEQHRVTPEEAEDVFFNDPLLDRSDVRHSKGERRYYALGRTGTGRGLFVAFAIRRSLLRVISVRDMNRRERQVYARHEYDSLA